MNETTTRQELVRALGEVAGAEAGREYVEQAASEAGAGAKEEYTLEEVRDICGVLAEEEAGDLAVAAREFAVRKDAERRFGVLFEHIPDPAIIVRFEDGESIVTRVNSAFEEVFGFDAEEAVGEPINDLVVPEGRDAEARSIDRRTTEGERVEREVRRLADGELRDFLFRSVPIETEAGYLESYGIYTDITERKRHQRDLERQNERLEEFASVVSHDLRNPLNVAQGYLELARDTGDVDHLEPLADAHRRMERLVEDLLALARQGQAVGERSTVDLERVVDRAWEHVATGEASLEVTDDLPTVRADPDRVPALFENLFNNAVEHGGADVAVTVGRLPDGVYVADDGAGIPAGERDRVLDHGYTTSDQGTGFGLSIVAGIVDAHDWTLELGDSEDGGARFEVRGIDSMG